MKTYDFALSWSVKYKSYFTDELLAYCRKKSLSFLWIDEHTVKDIIKKLKSGKIKIRVLLDTEATYNNPDDIYARLCYAVKDAGGDIINDPDRTRIFVDKSVMYFELARSGVPVPYTRVIRSWEPRSIKLSPVEIKKLGVPFIIKPGCGYGQKGLIKNATGSSYEIARARKFDNADNFLLQKKVYPQNFGRRRAWFRVLHVFDIIIPCWWDDRTCAYSHVSAYQFKKYKLRPLVQYTSHIAGLSGMVWFSTEIAAVRENKKIRFISIDHLNDQCDMSTKAETKDGLPDDIVRTTARHLIMKSCLDKKPAEKNTGRYSVILKKGKWMRPRGLNAPPRPFQSGTVVR